MTDSDTDSRSRTRIRQWVETTGLGSRWSFVSLVTLVYWLAPQSVRVFYPLQLEKLGASDLVIGLGVGASSVAGLVLAIPSGYLLDRFDFRRVLILTSIGLALTTGVFAVVSSVSLMVALMFLQGLFQMWVWLVLQAMITGVGTGGTARRQLSMFSLAWGVGLAAGPSVGAWVYGSWGFGAVSVSCFAVCLIGTLGAFFVPWAPRRAAASAESEQPPPEGEDPRSDAERSSAGTERPGQRDGSPEETAAPAGSEPRREPAAEQTGLIAAFRRTFGDSIVVGVMVSSFINIYVQSLRLSFYPLFLQRDGVSLGFVGLLLSTLGISSLGVRVFLSAVVKRFGYVKPLVWSTWIAIAGVSMTPLTTDPVVLVIGALMIGFGLGANPPITVNLLAESGGEDHGMAVGLRMVANRSAQVVQPLLFGGMAGAVGLGLAFPVSGALLGVSTVWMTRRLRMANVR